MKKLLCNIYGVGVIEPSIVITDNISNMNIYEKLNTITGNDWTYIIDDILNNQDNSYSVVISLFINGRFMTGVGTDTSIKKATDDAVTSAFNILFPTLNQDTEIKSITTAEEEAPVEDKEVEPVNDFINFNDIDCNNDEEYSTIDEIDLNQPSIVTNDNDDDDECPIAGSNITNSQIRFMNEFKEHNQIDTDEKFDYYIKTWASNVAVDDINTKKELIQAGYDSLDNFIKWIKVMQPTLEKGIVSPI